MNDNGLALIQPLTWWLVLAVFVWVATRQARAGWQRRRRERARPVEPYLGEQLPPL